MIIKMAPQRRDDTLSITKVGKVLVINGEVFDFSSMSDGDRLPASAVNSEWLFGDITCQDGNLVICVILPLPENFSQEQAFPKDMYDVPDGVVLFPLPNVIEEPEVIPFEEVKV